MRPTERASSWAKQDLGGWEVAARERAVNQSPLNSLKSILPEPSESARRKRSNHVLCKCASVHRPLGMEHHVAVRTTEVLAGGELRG